MSEHENQEVLLKVEHLCQYGRGKAHADHPARAQFDQIAQRRAARRRARAILLPFAAAVNGDRETRG